VKRFLVTAGPTREYIDTVRFLSNASSGRTGYLIAGEAFRRGNEVVLVSGPTSIPPPEGPRVVEITSAEEMAEAVLRHLPSADVVIGCAAVCDWKPESRSERKLGKRDGDLEIRWVRTADVMRLVGERKGGRLLIGFALEDFSPRENAFRKAVEKNLDYVVLNGPENMNAPSGAYELLSRTGRLWPLGVLTKKKLAELLVDLALRGEESLPGPAQ